MIKTTLLLFLYCTIYLLISEWLLKRILKIKSKKEKGIFYKHYNKTHKMIERALLVIYIISLFFAFSGVKIHYLILSYFFILLSIRMIFEWIYNRERKRVYSGVKWFICVYMFYHYWILFVYFLII